MTGDSEMDRPPALSPGSRAGHPLAEASTIPAAWYFDADHHRAELDRVLCRTWQHVARSGQLENPGDHATAEIGGERVLIVRGADRELRAFSNVCRHRAGVVAQGEGCGAKAFRCTYHGWTYGLQGELMAAPEMEGVSGFSPDRFGLPPLRCESWGPYVFVNLDPQALSLRETIGSLPARATGLALDALAFGGRETYTIACNWKVYVDNYLEGYHLPRAHPGLNKVLDYGRYVVETDGNLVIQSAPARSESVRADTPDAGQSSDGGDDPSAGGSPGAGRAAAPSIAVSGEGGAGKGSLYVWLYPNFMLNVSPEYAQTNIILPLGPETTLCIFDYYFPLAEKDKASGNASRNPSAAAGNAAPSSREPSAPAGNAGPSSREPSAAARDAAPSAREKSKTWADSIQQEDIWLCETVQQNLRSRFYSTGRYSVKRENGLYHFHELLRRALA